MYACMYTYIHLLTISCRPRLCAAPREYGIERLLNHILLRMLKCESKPYTAYRSVHRLNPRPLPPQLRGPAGVRDRAGAQGVGRAADRLEDAGQAAARYARRHGRGAAHGGADLFII